MGIDSEALEVQEAQIAALSDVRKKWHVQPAFSVDFIGYFLDRITRLKDIKNNLEVQVASNSKLVTDQLYLKEKYDQMIREHEDLNKESESLKDKIQALHSSILSLCPNKSFPLVASIGKPAAAPLTVPPPAATPPARPMSVPTAAALKMGVGFPLQTSTTNNAGKILSTQHQKQDKNELLHNCGICKRCTDQHLLAKCDTCHFHYHLGCLNPPLTRHPKKSRLYGWQCSECDNSDGSDKGVTMPEGPRKSRTRYSKDGIIVPANSRPDTPVKVEPKEEVKEQQTQPQEGLIEGGGGGEGTQEQETKPEEVKQESPKKEPEVTSLSIKIEPIIIPKMKITPTRGRGRGRGRGRPPGRKSIERPIKEPKSEEVSAQAQSPTSLPVSIPVVWPASTSPVVAAASLANPPPIDLSVDKPASSSTPKASKSEKRKAKKEKKHKQKPVYFIKPAPQTEQPKEEEEEEVVASSSTTKDATVEHDGDDEEEEEELEETNESIVDKNLMNLSSEMRAQSHVADSSALNTTNELEEDKGVHHRKKKNKEKHKNKNHDLDSSKEHKRKRKRKYGMENTTEVMIADDQGASHPRIKIKFKAIPLPGTSADATEAEKQFMYVPQEEEAAFVGSPRRTKSPHKMKSPDSRQMVMGTPTKQVVSGSLLFLQLVDHCISPPFIHCPSWLVIPSSESII